MADWQDDPQFEESCIKSVEGSRDEGWFVGRDDGWSCFVPKDSPIEPKVGSAIRLYGRGIGYAFRGMLIDGQVVFYRTEAEDDIHRDEESYGRDCTDLLARWDAGKSVWSVEMGGLGPGYEQAIQITAFEMLRVLLDQKPDASKWQDTDAWATDRERLDCAVTPRLSGLGLSGAQFGAAMGLATRLYMNGPVKSMKTVDADRRIQVSRTLPSLATQAA